MASEVFSGLIAGLRTVFVTRSELDRVHDSFPSMGEIAQRLERLENEVKTMQASQLSRPLLLNKTH